MTLISAYIELFIQGEMTGGNVFTLPCLQNTLYVMLINISSRNSSVLDTV